MKPLLKLGFCDTFGVAESFFIDILSKHFDVIIDNSNPEYLIFGDENFGQENLKYNDCVKIFYTGENRRFWNYKCDYAITFDRLNVKEHYRLPLYVMNNWELNNIDKVPDIFNVKNEFNRDKFCSFVVSNPCSQIRNQFFFELNKYKKVDSGGPLFNNIGYIIPRENAAVQKHKFLSQYKFNMCFENSSYPGYVTEKLFQALYSKTIPIYYGCPEVEKDFNIDGILSIHQFKDVESFIQRIIEVDSDDLLYQQMINQPIFNDEEQLKVFDYNSLLNWFIDVVYK